MGDGKQAAGRDAGAKSQRRAIVLELEHVAVNGRQIKFEALKAALKSVRVELTDPLYSRYCLRRYTKDGIAALLASLDKTAAAADVAEKYTATINEAFADSALKTDPLFETIVKVARKHNARLGVLSSLDSAVTETLAKTLDLAGLGATIFNISAGDQRSYSGDQWMHLARRVETAPRRCVAVCTQADSAHAALAARMRCIVRLDRFNLFQDFSGADVVAESVGAAAIEGLLDAHKGE